MDWYKPAIAAALVAAALAPMASADSHDTQDIQLHCNIARDGINSFESWYAHQNRDQKTGCWAHFGHNQYFVGRDKVYALHGGTAKVSSTESERSPMTEPGDPGYPPQWRLPIEVSMDGTNWRKVASVQWDFFESEWQVERSFDADGEPFRYLRIRQPRSAMQGLSGYLDKSALELNVSTVREVDEGPRTQGAVAMSCSTDVMETVFAEHPCWFGGINRYDAASFFHTYPLGGLGVVDTVEGSVVTNNFRIGPLDGETIPDSETEVLVQTSRNGSTWTTVHSFHVTHGQEAAFAADVPDTDARFVRLTTTWHPLWADDPAAKHPEGYLLDSGLTVEGQLPAP